MFNIEITYQTLSEYLCEIKEFIQDIADYRWVVAEIAKIDQDKNGHYWLELVEKKDNSIIAQTGGVIWYSNSNIVNNFYIKTGMMLQRGVKILFRCKATFHERYGFKLNIFAIDPSFSLGEMALKKKEVIDRLTKEGLIDKNKELELPVVIQRIAIISSETAAGYEDFLKILNENQYGFKFHTQLFDAFVQGDAAASSIIDALLKCSMYHSFFDAIVIIRGGGSVVDLHCFNDYELAKTITLMPVPVLTGIGHTRDETVADIVACRSFKTPSELAKFIVDRAFDYESKLEDLRKRIYQKINAFVTVENTRFLNNHQRFNIAVNNCLERLGNKINITLNRIHNSVLMKLRSEESKISSFKNQLNIGTNRSLKTEEIRFHNLQSKIKFKLTAHFTNAKFNLRSIKERMSSKMKNILEIKNLQIERLSEKLHLLSPENILKRGYSITYRNGKVLKNSQDVTLGDEIYIQLYRGKLISKITEKEEDDGKSYLF